MIIKQSVKIESVILPLAAFDRYSMISVSLKVNKVLGDYQPGGNSRLARCGCQRKHFLKLEHKIFI